MTGDEFGDYADIKELRAKAKKYYKEHLQGTSVENPILGTINLSDNEVQFTRAGLGKMTATSAKEHKLLLVPHLPELIKSAGKVTQEKNVKKKRDASYYSYLHAEAVIDGKVQPVTITIFTDVNGNKYYNHILPAEENTQKSKDLSVPPAQAAQEDDGIPAIDKSSVEDNIPQQRGKNNIKYSFAGENAQNAPLEQLERAKQMEQEGADRQEIWDATGWTKGKDNKWRFEIPDNLDAIDFSPLDGGAVAALGDIYDNPALYAAYPKLKDIIVSVVSDEELDGAEAATNGKEIYFNEDFALELGENDFEFVLNDKKEEAGATLVH